MRRIALTAACALALLPSAAAGQGVQSLKKSLSAAFKGASAASGAYVIDADTNKPLFAIRDGKARILASNTKIFTTSATLAQYGAQATLPTEVLGAGKLAADGEYTGDLYLRGSGDPTFGASSFARKAYGSAGVATVEGLASQLAAAGIQRVTGRVLGDESRFDARRSGQGSGASSDNEGLLSALSFNRGFANPGGSAFQSSPPAFAAAQLDAALGNENVTVKGKPAAAATPAAATVLATVRSAPLATIIRLTNKPSDNYLAEMLAKDLALSKDGRGTTSGGAHDAANFAEGLGSHASLTDGSGLSRGDRAAPRSVVKLLDAMRDRPEFPAFFDSLTIAGVDGTLAGRMRGGPAKRRCRGKTGTLSNVSALSGYCKTKGGQTLVFSILMNNTGPAGARAIQDRMVQAIAAYRATPAISRARPRR